MTTTRSPLTVVMSIALVASVIANIAIAPSFADAARARSRKPAEPKAEESASGADATPDTGTPDATPDTATPDTATPDATPDQDGGADSADPTESSSDSGSATSADDARLVDSSGGKTTFGDALGSGARVVVVTKPWCEANAQLIGQLSHYRLRLNRGGLRSGVVFLRAERDEALRAMDPFKGRVRWFIDPEGALARLLAVKTLPALLLIDADGAVKFSAPLLNDELVKQLAKNFNKPERVFRAPRVTASIRPGIPPAKGGLGRYSIR